MAPLSRGLLDTSVVIDLGRLPAESLPDESAISSASLAELHFGVRPARPPQARLDRTRLLQHIESAYRALPIDADTARIYGSLAHTLRAAGRSPRPRPSLPGTAAILPVSRDSSICALCSRQVRALSFFSGSTVHSRVGPVPIVTTGPEPCTTVAPQCPNPRPQNARTVIWVGTCAFEGQDGSCQPVQLPGCPVDFKIVAMSLAHPNPNIRRPCIITGDVHLDVRATPEGGATILWEALEFDPTTCRIVGPELRGEATLAGPCCSKIIDIYFPVGDFTFRMLTRTDWQR